LNIDFQANNKKWLQNYKFLSR